MEHLSGGLKQSCRLLDHVGISVTDREAYRANSAQEVLFALALALAERDILDLAESIISQLPCL